MITPQPRSGTMPGCPTCRMCLNSPNSPNRCPPSRIRTPSTRAAKAAARAALRRRFPARFPACPTANRLACAASSLERTCAVRFSAIRAGRPAARACSHRSPCVATRELTRWPGSRNSKSIHSPLHSPLRNLSASSRSNAHRSSSSHWRISHDSSRCAHAAPVPANPKLFRLLDDVAECACSRLR